MEYPRIFSNVNSFPSSNAKIALCSAPWYSKTLPYVFPQAYSQKVKKEKGDSNDARVQLKAKTEFLKNLGNKHREVHEQAETNNEGNDKAGNISGCYPGWLFLIVHGPPAAI